MQREASMKECTSNFPVQDKNGLIYLCMYIEITTTVTKNLFYEKAYTTENSSFLLYVLQCTYTIKLNLK